MTRSTWDEMIENRDPRDARRLAILDRLGILDAGAERGYDDVARFARYLFADCSVALAFVTRDRVMVKALQGEGVRHTPREGSLSAAVVDLDDALVVHDAATDPRFAQAGAVVGPPHVSFYAGVPIRSGGEPLGALTVYSSEARAFDESDLEHLWTLGRHVERLIELRWFRALSTEPSQHHVDGLAAQIRTSDDFARLLHSEVHPAWIFDLETYRFLAVNDRAVEAYGWTREEFLAMTLDDIRPTEDRVALRAVLEPTGFRAASRRQWRHRRANGVTFSVHVNSAPVTVDGTEGRLAVVTDLSTRLYGRSALVHAATHDALTGLPNRPAFLERLARNIEACGDLVVLYVDLDGFKNVNATIGSRAGDQAIAATAARVAACVRDTDTVARIGGDELAVLCPMADEREALAIAERLVTAMRTPIVIDGRDHHLTVSIGAAARTACSDAERLLGDAELAMRAARREGLGGIGVFDAAMREEAIRRSELVRELGEALHRHEFVVHYQPILDLHGDDVHLEALVRWQHPTRGLLAPGDFLDVAHDAGLLPKIGSQVLRQLAAVAVRMREDGLRARIAFNLPAAQLDESFVVELLQVVADSGMDPRQLIVEVTESAFAHNVSAPAAARRLRALGVGMSIDDFGTGYSSIDRLRSLDVDALKLDRSFTAQVHTVQGLRLARAVVSLADAIGVPVVAEGVETAAQLEAVRELGCRYVQGYLLARPMPEQDAVRRLHSGFSVCVD